MSLKALITGFEAYAGRGTNPAAEVARALDGTRVGPLQVTGVRLPVSLDEAPKRLIELIDKLTPDITLCLGLWPGEPMIRIERLALNRADFEIPDQTGRLPHEELLLPSGPDGLCATIPLQETIQALRDLGIPARLSGTAGTYLCNATMYRMLHHARSCHPKMLGGFMHLPYLPSQVTELIEDVRRNKSLELHQRADLASMALDSMLDAVRTTLTVCSSKIVLA